MILPSCIVHNMDSYTHKRITVLGISWSKSLRNVLQEEVNPVITIHHSVASVYVRIVLVMDERTCSSISTIICKMMYLIIFCIVFNCSFIVILNLYVLNTMWYTWWNIDCCIVHSLFVVVLMRTLSLIEQFILHSTVSCFTKPESFSICKSFY